MRARQLCRVRLRQCGQTGRFPPEPPSVIMSPFLSFLHWRGCNLCSNGWISMKIQTTVCFDLPETISEQTMVYYHSSDFCRIRIRTVSCQFSFVSDVQSSIFGDIRHNVGLNLHNDHAHGCFSVMPPHENRPVYPDILVFSLQCHHAYGMIYNIIT